MAEVIISPGVFQQETDQSFYTANPQVIGAAIVGPTVKGSPFVPTYVTSYNQFVTLYGDIFKSGSYYYEYFTSQAAKEYFANGGSTMLITKIISGSDGASTYASSSVIGRGPVASASLFSTANPTNGSIFSITGSSDGILSGSVLLTPQIATFAVTSSATLPSASWIRVPTGTTGLDNLNNLIAAINSRQATLGVRAELSGSSSPYGLYLTSIYPGIVGNQIYASGSALVGGATGSQTVVFEALAWGDLMNNTTSGSANEDGTGGLISGSKQNVRWEVPYTDPITGLFTVIVRRGSDNVQQKDVLETWTNLSLDPLLPNYVSRVIGDSKPVPDVVNGIVTFTGNFANKSQYIRVASVPGVIGDSLDNSGNFKTRTVSQYLPLERSSGSFGGGKAATNMSPLMNETIGIGTDTGSNIQGFSQADYVNGFNMLTDKDAFQFNVLLAPGVGLDASTAVTKMINVVENRGDSIAIIDNGIYGTSVAQAVVNASNQQSSYAATYYPWVQLYSQGLGKSVWCPPSTVIGGVLAYNDTATAEWFAPAGLNRGGIPSVIKAERRVQQTDRDILYNGRVNPIATFPGVGVTVWGQKTLQKKPSALDRVNVRRLMISLKQFIGGVARTLVFEQNTTATRNRFVAQVNPYLSSVVQRQGLYAYKVVMDATNNTADVVDRNQLVGQIYIQPTKTAEFVILNFNILPTGATFPA